MSKALDIFLKQSNARLLYTSEERSLIENQLRAMKCLESGAIFDIEKKQVVFVNKIMDLYDIGLCIRGYGNSYRVVDYGKTWREVREDED